MQIMSYPTTISWKYSLLFFIMLVRYILIMQFLLQLWRHNCIFSETTGKSGSSLRHTPQWRGILVQFRQWHTAFDSLISSVTSWRINKHSTIFPCGLKSGTTVVSPYIISPSFRLLATCPFHISFLEIWIITSSKVPLLISDWIILLIWYPFISPCP